MGDKVLPKIMTNWNDLYELSSTAGSSYSYAALLLKNNWHTYVFIEPFIEGL